MIWTSSSSWCNRQAYLFFVLFLKQGIPSSAEIYLRNRFSKDSEPFKAAMQKFTEKIISMIRITTFSQIRLCVQTFKMVCCILLLVCLQISPLTQRARHNYQRKTAAGTR
ncbi:uncharacterized protein LOC103954410 [Pyrus x bretschneideri]|uniref:uncharacterized protein LOC103954410 n=1 Tax=Pyrus x bretschneideri TaxID=225117 RepID=UPI0020304CEB|nr:uncharacterized protein LOC103954410 [Pyrus x bretschneideri]